MRPVLIILALILLVTPVMGATYLKSSDLSVSVEGKKSSYTPGGKVNVTITIEPKSVDVAKSMENRDWTFYNYLESPKYMTISFVTMETYVTYTNSTSREKITFKHYEINAGPVAKIIIKIRGYAPLIKSGFKEFTFLKVAPEDGDVLLFNITIINPSKLSEEIGKIESEFKELKSEVFNLSRYVTVTSLENLCDRISANITIAKDYYNSKDYERASERIECAKRDLSTLKREVEKRWAEYYLNRVKDLLNDVNALMLEAESYLNVMESTGKTEQVMLYKVNLTQIKYSVNEYKEKLGNLEDLYDSGKYPEVIDRGKDLSEKVKLVKAELESMVSKIKSQLKAKPTPTPTKKAAGFKLNRQMLIYIGAGIGIVIGGAAGAVAISRWRQRRRWDELR